MTSSIELMCKARGWLDWVKSGECAGTTGEALHMEAFEVKLVEKK